MSVNGFLLFSSAPGNEFVEKYFFLKDNRLLYSDDELDDSDKTEIYLDDSSVEIVSESKYSHKFCFELTVPRHDCIFILATNSGTELQDWMNGIRRSMLRIRRKKLKN